MNPLFLHCTGRHHYHHQTVVSSPCYRCFRCRTAKSNYWFWRFSLPPYLCVWAGCLSGCQQTKTKQKVTFCCCCFIRNKRIGGGGDGAICIHQQGPKVLPSTLLIARWALPPVIQPVSQLSCIASHNFTYYYFVHQVCVKLLLCAAVCGSNYLLALHLQSSRSNAIAIFKQNHFQ